jgi:hypothetical protein
MRVRAGVVPTGGARLLADAGTRARAVNWAVWAKRPRREEGSGYFPFSFFPEFLIVFLFFSLWISNQTQTKFQIQTNSNICIKQK